MRGAEPAADEAASGLGSGSRRRYLFTVDGENADDILPIVCDLVTDAEGELVIGSPVVLPAQTPLSMPEPRLEGDRQAAEMVLRAKQQCQSRLSVEQAVMVGHDREHVVQRLVEQNDISTVITEDRPRSGLRSILGFDGVDDSSLEDYCDTLIVTRIEGAEDFDSVLVPVAEGPHSGMAIDVGLALARQNDASLELLHVYSTGDEEAKATGEAVLEHGADRIQPFTDAEITLLDADEVEAAIIEYTEPFDVAVLGAPREGVIRQFVLGTIPDTVSANAEGTVFVAHRGNVSESWIDRWLQ